MAGRVIVAEDPAAIAREGAARVAFAAARASEERGRFAIALAGGSTPRRLYESLAEAAPDWSAAEVFFGDERCVGPEDQASNYRMARESLLDRLPVRAVHRIRGEVPPPDAAAAYEEEVREAGGFDLVLLGLGTDGHTASLFPGGPEVDEALRLVVPSVAPVEPRERVTLTLPALNASREVLFLVAGEDKAEVLARILDGEDLPAARVRPDGGRTTWLVDRAAARLLPDRGRTT